MKKVNLKALLATTGVLIGFLGIIDMCIYFPKIMVNILFGMSFIALAISVYKLLSNTFK
jgi:hypothetical protein